MIPKIIHYCWFGGNDKSALALSCIESWKFYLSDYEIIEWNEGNFNVNSCEYVSEAYESKKWAHVSDYVRAKVLHTHGGIYLDTDVEIRRNLDQFLVHKAFSGFELKGFPFTALWGTEKGHHWPLKVVEYYHKAKFTLETNTVSVSKLLVSDYGINPNLDKLQVFDNDIFIYPSTYFCLDMPNYATHHFEGSWLEKKNGVTWKDHLHNKYFENQFFERSSFQYIIEKALQNSGQNSIVSMKVLLKVYLLFILRKWKS